MNSCSQLLAFAGLSLLGGCAPQPSNQPISAAAAPPAPISWGVTGDADTAYALSDVSADGRAMSFRRVFPGTGFGATAAYLDPTPYRGRRIRYSAVIRSENAAPGASTWIRIDGPSSQKIALENNTSRALHGTVDWTQQVSELDVPLEAQRIYYGLLLSGDGVVYARDVRVQIIDRPAMTALEWRTDGVSGSSPFYEVIDTSDAGRTLTLRHMVGGGTMNNEFGTATTTAPVGLMGGKRVTIRAELQTRGADAATLWVRAEGLGKTLALQNNMAHPIVGTAQWTTQTAILDLPAGTDRIAYGLLLMGAGGVSARNITVSFAPPTGAAATGQPMPP